MVAAKLVRCGEYSINGNDENHPYDPDAAPEDVRGIDRLIRAMLEFEIPPNTGNVYAELGSTWFNLLTDLDEKRTAELAGRDPREAKALIAQTVTAWLHGEAPAREARARFDHVFRDRQVPEDVPRVALPASELDGGRLWIVKLLVRLGFANSNGEARRLVAGRGVKLDGVAVEDDNHQVDLLLGLLSK